MARTIPSQFVTASLAASLFAFSALAAVAACGDDADSSAASPALADGGSADAELPSDDGSSDANATPDATSSLDAQPPTGCVDVIAAGHHRFDCDGIIYDVEVSPSCASGGCGIILDVHGMTMTAAQQDLSTGLRARGAARGYIVVQPTAPAAGLFGTSWTPGTDDAKVWQTMGKLRTSFKVDAKRVHVTGFSQGGSMAYRFACSHANEIASVAPVAPGSGTSLSNVNPPYELDCTFTGQQVPSRPIPIIHLHGKRDGLSPIDKGHQQRDAALAWLGTTTSTVVAQDATYTWTRYANPAGVVYEFIEHDYLAPKPLLPVPIGGHCMPGGTDLQVTPLQSFAFSCVPPTSIVWGDILVDFFDAHPLP